MELQVTLLGPTGVGKTTLLTAMYEQFEDTIGPTDLQLTPDDESAAILQERLVELKSLVDVFEARGRVGIEGTEASAGPDSLRSFSFGIGRKGSKPAFDLCFRDYPGGYHTVRATAEEKKFVKDLVGESAAVVIAIDAPALMEQDGKYNDRINRPDQIKSLFNAAYQDLDSPRLVIFAPVKCEKYLRSPELAKELSARVRSSYENLFNHFNSEQLNPWIASVIAPVQTVGSVIFSRLEIDEKHHPHFYFRKIRPDAQYNPQDSEQLLRYLLRFLLKLYVDRRQWRLLNFVRRWLGLDRDLEEAIAEFARGCKTDNGFVIVRGEKWLNF